MSGRDETDEEFDKRMEDIRKAGPGPIIQEMKDKENRARAQKTASPTAPLPPVLAPKKKAAPVELEPAIPRSPEGKTLKAHGWAKAKPALRLQNPAQNMATMQ